MGIIHLIGQKETNLTSIIVADKSDISQKQLKKSVGHLQNAKNESSRDDWETPKALFDSIAIRFNIKCDLDVCATKLTRKCRRYFDEVSDGLVSEWSGSGFFCNPPYSQTKYWIRKCSEQHWKNGIDGVALIFNHTPNMYFEHIWNLETDSFFPHVKVYPIKSRVKFLLDGEPIRDKNGRLQNAPYDSCWVVWK